MKTIKVRVFIISTLILAFALVGGATLAYFTTTVSNTDNTFSAGTFQMALDRDNGDTIPGPMFYTNDSEGQTVDGLLGIYPTGPWKPGDTYHRVLQAENIGSIDGTIKSVRASLSAGSRHLADKLQVKITTDPEGINEVATGTLGEFIDADKTFTPNPIDFNVGDLVSLHFWVTFPSNSDNSYQGDSAKVDFFVYAEQKTDD